MELTHYNEGEDVVIILDEGDSNAGVYRTLSRSMDYIADFLASVDGGDVQSLREGMIARETTYGWVIECEDRSFKALRSALRD